MALTKKQRQALASMPKSKRTAALRQYQAQDQQRQATRPRQRQGAPRVQRSLTFNAFAPGRAPLAFSVGRATHLRGLERSVVEVNSSTGDHQMVILNAVPGHFIGQAVPLNLSTGVLGTAKTFEMGSAGFGTGGPNATSPSSAITARFSVRLRNISAALEVAGQCYALNLASGTDLNAAADYVNLANYVISHPRTTTYSAHELRTCHQFNSHPVDQSRYHDFRLPTTTIDGWKSGVYDPGLSTLVFLFPKVGTGDTGQQYEFTMVATYYARYRVTGPLAHAAEEPPTAPLAMLNAARDFAERVGSVGQQVLNQIAHGFGQNVADNFMRRGRPQLALPPSPPILVD